MLAAQRAAFFAGEKSYLSVDKRGANLTGHPLRVFHACGDMDFLTPDNRRFSPQFAQKPGVTCEYHEYPGGHNYDVWDPCIRDFVQWLMA